MSSLLPPSPQLKTGNRKNRTRNPDKAKEKFDQQIALFYKMDALTLDSDWLICSSLIWPEVASTLTVL
jgi:hypothetical protein